jgi:fructosamine-3-kinase
MSFVHHIFEKHAISVISTQALSGGDINDVYKVKSTEQDYVLKLNSASLYPDMFEKEAKSLKLLSTTNSFTIPEVIAYGDWKDKTYLILTYISSEQNSDFSEKFAVDLAKLHRNQSEKYGLDFDNYIGRLHQFNSPKTSDPVGFYINSRLEPQFRLALKNGFVFKNIDKLFKNIEQLVPKEKASLIHGDLWSGNYLITENAKACIYDPAICYASREMDIGMMKLFGGYPQSVFEIYNEIFPLEADWKYRIELWQLYYILVHVNLFGSSYFQRAKSMLAKYSP